METVPIPTLNRRPLPGVVKRASHPRMSLADVLDTMAEAVAVVAPSVVIAKCKCNRECPCAGRGEGHVHFIPPTAVPVGYAASISVGGVHVQ